MVWYHVSEPSAYLAITGAGIDGVAVKKKAFIMPFQKVTKFSITPFDFSLSLQAMTVEKLSFSLPAVFTIGPDDESDNNQALVRYAVLLTGNTDGGVATPGKSGAIGLAEGRGHVQNIVKGIIEGETRSIVSTMTMEELFNARKMFRDKVIKNVQTELDQFGLKIYNANVKELQDTPGSEYFAYLSRKAHEGALNQAKVDVAEARMVGDVGESQRQGQTKQEIAKIHADTAVKETMRKAEKAKADAELTSVQIEIERNLQISRVEAGRKAEERDVELQKTVEIRRAEMELERQRATTVIKARINRESDQEKADALLYTRKLDAEGYKTKRAKEAEGSQVAIKISADADYYRVQQEALAQYEKAKLVFETKKLETDAKYYQDKLKADALYYAKKTQADGLMEMTKAYGQLSNVLGGPSGLMHWMMLERGTYENMAAENAKAIHGLQPKINVWNTGSSDGVDTTAPIRNLFQSLPPLLETIQQQTGITAPTWLANMPKAETEKDFALIQKPQKNGTNGVK
ncbi:hypothetical protein BT63DRAFT_379104 [Microthyrium microscopicum]|uniref:Band 7 domain-containing protein n=1 Tax=Microthyrium microscopicum TaxID=703497 RepID=A0A6A6TZB2_9PEZI|nr:hypothetical protein BT63DRAFT_379104 [Microthyrium microscopicum]